jgi:prepilin-type N-terminal cleavage/methylation domain-containing protein
MSSKGFTVLELLIVIAIIAILSVLVVVQVSKAKESAYFSSAQKDLRSIRDAVELYYNKHEEYPPDASRDAPPGLEEHLASGEWPKGAWPESVFDWENWSDPDTGEKIYQISIRFCSMDDPEDCSFPKQEWAEDFQSNSSVFYCVSGPCRPHISEAPNYPGYCVNCEEKQYPYGIY